MVSMEQNLGPPAVNTCHQILGIMWTKIQRTSIWLGSIVRDEEGVLPKKRSGSDFCIKVPILSDATNIILSVQRVSLTVSEVLPTKPQLWSLEEV